MLRTLLLITLLSVQTVALAEPVLYNHVNFQVEAAQEVDNDLLIAVLSTEIQHKQPARVAQQLNRTLNNALKTAKSFSTVKTSSGQQRTYPIYRKNNRIDGWRGRGEIRLESRDFKAAGELIMQLQSTIQLSSINFSVAPDTRSATENELIEDAIKAFQLRADAIRNAMGAKSYKTVNLNINNNGGSHRPMPMMRSMAMAESAPAPDFAGGESRMSVQINGTIELE